jgi:hypothetical protein
MYTTEGDVADILSGPVAHGTWDADGANHLLFVMADGRLLDWNLDTGVLQLWHYDPSNSVLAGPPQTLTTKVNVPSYITAMHDGRLIVWNSDSGAWALWDYHPNGGATNTFTINRAGVWKDIRTVVDDSTTPSTWYTHRLIGMPDGNLLDWGPREQGKWRCSTTPGRRPTTSSRVNSPRTRIPTSPTPSTRASRLTTWS